MPTENSRARCYPSLPTDRQRSELSEGLHLSSHRCLLGSTGSPTKKLSASSVSRLGGVLPALLIAEPLQASQHRHGPLLASLQCVHVPLVLGGPELDTVLQVQPHEC